jgi:hypothetical protein
VLTGEGLNREAVDVPLTNSTCVAAFEFGAQDSFARVVSDYSTFAYLCDVFVSPAYRGRVGGPRRSWGKCLNTHRSKDSAASSS